MHADFLPAEIDEHYHPEVELIGDLAHTLWMLNERIVATPLPSLELDRQGDLRRRIGEELAAHAEDHTQGSIRPQKVLWDVRQALGSMDMLLSDVGAHKMWIARHYHCHEPNTCLIPNGSCSMGFALPGAIAASLVHPDRKVLAICGDAGFLMNVQDMETAKRLGCNLTVMIWEDHEYGLIAWKQEAEFGHHTDRSLGNPDWMGLAAAFGWKGHRVERSADLAGTLAAALGESGRSPNRLPQEHEVDEAARRDYPTGHGELIVRVWVAILDTIGNTRTASRLKVKTQPDKRIYPTGVVTMSKLDEPGARRLAHRVSKITTGAADSVTVGTPVHTETMG